jgi:hypothetical protein
LATLRLTMFDPVPLAAWSCGCSPDEAQGLHPVKWRTKTHNKDTDNFLSESNGM